MATVIVNGQQVNQDYDFNVYATQRFMAHNRSAEARGLSPYDSRQTLSLNPTQYLRILRDYQALQLQRANQFVRDARRFAPTAQRRLAPETRPRAAVESPSPVVTVSGREVRPNDDFARFVLGELRRNAGFRPLVRDGRVVISLTQTQYDRASQRYVRHVSDEANRALRAAHSRPQVTAHREGGRVVYENSSVFTIRGGRS